MELDELVEAVKSANNGEGLYLRWSRGPDHDRSHPTDTSRDDLTGAQLPGLSASPLVVEPWWGGRSVRLWVARRISDYLHLGRRRSPDVRPWLLEGRETGRGPDNEPLVTCRRAVAWVSDDAVRQAQEVVSGAAGADAWGPMDRSGAG